jgi:small subunit ribosomal protein S17
VSTKILTGEVVSNKMLKTVVVKTEMIKMHAKYKKRFKVHNKFKAHCEIEGIKVGDIVNIQETRPYSKTKNWIVLGKA